VRDAVRVLEAPAREVRAIARPAARILAFPPHRVAVRGPRAGSAIGNAEDPGIRGSRVRSARARLAIGYYDRPHVRGWIADIALRELQRP